MDSRPVIVITGATNGLGRLAALDFAGRGAHLGIVARSPHKVNELRAEIDRAAPGTPVDSFIADLTSLHDVRRAGRQIDAHYERIDVLVNNAGVHAFSQRITGDGFAEMIAVNYLAPWVLTTTLLDKLVAAAPARIVTVASGAAHQARGIDLARDLTRTEDYSRRESGVLYGRTKLLDMMFSLELGRRLADKGVTVNCCDPGFNTTGLGRDLPLAGILERILTALHVGDPRRGTGIIVRLATDPAFAETATGYYSVKAAGPLDPPEYGRGEKIQTELWQTTAALVDRVFSTAG